MRLYEYQIRPDPWNPKVYVWCKPEEVTALPQPIHLTDQYCGDERMVEVSATEPNLVALTLMGLKVGHLRPHRGEGK